MSAPDVIAAAPGHRDLAFRRSTSTGSVDGPRGRRPAAGHRHPAGHLQLHRGHDQRRERRGRGRRATTCARSCWPTAPAPSSARRWAARSRPAVYIGHPGWKAAGGRTAYSLASGVVIALLCFLGLFGAARRAAAAAGDRADPALHRAAHRRAGVPGGAEGARGRRRDRDHPEHRVVGDRADRQRARCGRDDRGAGRRRRADATPGSSTTAPRCSAAARSSPGWCSGRSWRSSSTSTSSPRRRTAWPGRSSGSSG